jgi:hypothetical protein
MEPLSIKICTLSSGVVNVPFAAKIVYLGSPHIAAV